MAKGTEVLYPSYLEKLKVHQARYMKDPMIAVAEAEEKRERSLAPEIARHEAHLKSLQDTMRKIGREMVSLQLRIRELKRKQGIYDDKELEARKAMMDGILDKESAPQILYPEW